MAMVAMLRHDPLYDQISSYCERRTECYAACTNGNFPYLNCERVETEIEYNGVVYTDFFIYPRPQLKEESEIEHYN